METYKKTAHEVLEEAGVKPDEGLSYAQAKSRLAAFGPNVLARSKAETLADIFIRQFQSPLIYVLIFAAIIVFSLGLHTDAFVIMAVVILNVAVGTYQEGKAKNSLERLKGLVRHKALVRRDGEEILTSAEEIVFGDILILHEGSRISADARIIKAESLTVDESILTGEAYTIAKDPDVITKKDLVIGDQKNMLFAGCGIASGYCEAVVVATGYESQLGQISKELLETAQVPLPLAGKILKLTHFIGFSVVAIAALILVVGLIRGIEGKEILTAVIGLSVSIVPAGLPIAVTIVLSKGVWRMVKKRAIVRQMAAVEAMGNVDILLVDKTGTITTSQMIIKKIFLDGVHFSVSGQGYQPEGEITCLPAGRTGGSKQAFKKLTKILSLVYLSLKADIVREEHGDFKPIGDPTEVSIAVLCQKLGLLKEKLEREYKTIIAKPFNSKKRYIEAKFSRGNEKWDVYVGAPDFLSRDLKIDHKLHQDYQNLTAEGLRVVGVAVYGSRPRKLLGYALLAIDEDLRQDVKASIADAKRAGLRVAMMTGDFAQTAKSIAKEVGIFEEGDEILTGEDLEKLSQEELAEKIDKTSVFARITPSHKLKIVGIFKKRGQVVAMTGDGVNDGPALQAADLGIGLGSGTQVAKDSADIVLTDDSFSTITAAIAEGRSIYLNLKKVILYLFSTSLGEVLVIGGAVLAGLPLPLVAVQIIWLNFVTDGFFVVALAQDPPEEGLLSKSEVKSESLIDSLMIRRSLLMAFAMLMATMPIFYFLKDFYSLTYARSVTLLILSVTQWFNALNVRSSYKSVLKTPLNNHFLLLSFAAVFILQILAIQTDFGNRIFHTQDLSLSHWLLAFFVSTLIILFEELRKLRSS